MLIASLGSKSVLVISSWLGQKQCREDRIYFSLRLQDPVRHGGHGNAARSVRRVVTVAPSQEAEGVE